MLECLDAWLLGCLNPADGVVERLSRQMQRRRCSCCSQIRHGTTVLLLLNDINGDISEFSSLSRFVILR